MMQAHSERGFSLVELLVAISASTILLLLMGNYVVDAILGANNDYNQTLVLSNAKEAVNVVARQVRLAKSVESANDQPDNHAPGAPGNLYSWSGAAGSGGTLILSVPAKDSTGSVIYIDSLHNSMYTDNVIYYLDSSTHRLYRRYVANASAPGDTGVTTCPPSAATSTCPADAVVVDDVANLTTTYLDNNNTVVSNPSGTEAVNYTVTETRTIHGHVYTGTYSTIAALRNR
jgi:prepilin-type N-terminal cleavage/methylation domain-containing protein